MRPVFTALLAFVASLFRSRLSLILDNVALRHQLAVYKQTIHRPRLRPTDRLFWAWLSRFWSGWAHVLAFVQPRTVITWQRKRFRDHWRRVSRQGTPGRPAIATEVRDLIRAMWQVNPAWGSPRIVGELRKLGIDVAKSTVTFRVLFVLVILAHERRRVVHGNVTEHPTAQWTAQQVVEAFPWDTVPRYLLRDRDRIYGAAFRQRVRHMGLEEVLIAPRSPWQNPYVERLMGSIRRECLDHVVVFHAQHLQRILTGYFAYYHQ